MVASNSVAASSIVGIPVESNPLAGGRHADVTDVMPELIEFATVVIPLETDWAAVLTK